MRKTNKPSKRVKALYNHLPLRISEKSFNKYFRPFLSQPERSRDYKISLWKVFNYILYQLHTGCQWRELPIDIDPASGKSEISYVAVWNWFHRWSMDKSFERAFIYSVQELQEKKKLRLKRLHADGSNSLAKKGAKLSGIRGTSTRGAVKF
jgi:transposase